MGDCIKPMAKKSTKKAKTFPPRYNGKHPGGRPTKYDPKYCSQLIAYMKRGGKKFSKPMTVSHGLQEGGEIVDHLIGKLPAFFQGFAEKIGVSMETLDEWGDVHPEFAESYKRAKRIQLQQMIEGGLSGVYQQSSLIFALKNMHLWRDQTEVKHSGEVKTGPLIYLPAVEDYEPVNGNGNGAAKRV